jgi:predicted NBD/HSP70 family sugar kinase
MKHATSKKERDKQLIQALIWRLGPISGARIHELTRLQRSDISRLARELLNEGKLLQAGRADNPMGRKRVMLRLNEEKDFVVGVGFDDQGVVAATTDLYLQIKSIVREATRLDGGTEGLVQQLLSSSREAIRQAGVDAKKLLGIGVAGSGLVNNRQGMMVMSSTIEFCKQVPFREIFQKEFRVPIFVENITRAKTLAERTLGAGEMAEDMIYVEYGRTGIGAGVIIAGKLFYGSGCGAGEFGHTHVMVDGPACKCGSFGCLEAVAGAAALESRIRKAIAEGSPSVALSLAEGEDSRLSGWTVLRAASMGDKTCSAIVEQAGNYLGLGLANLVNLFNPSLLVIDQRLSLAGDGLLEQIVKVVRRQALHNSADGLEIRFGKLGSDASVLGAGAVVLERHFEIPALKPPWFMTEAFPAPPRHAFAAHSA